MKKLFYLMFAALAFMACNNNEPSDNGKSGSGGSGSGGSGSGEGGGSSSSAVINPRSNNGAMPGLFTVDNGKQVHFSQGNLQYCASSRTWRFATNQWDTIGIYNEQIGKTEYTGWIDLFGWGTGNAPVTTDVNGDYSSFSEWGENPIANGGNAAGLWRTLSNTEWRHLFRSRSNAEELFGLGSVNGINGIIILPDDWRLPSGLTFNPSTKIKTQDQEQLGILVWNENNEYYENSLDKNYEHNIYSAAQWVLMEEAGAIFLPAGGKRIGTSASTVNSLGVYWASAPVTWSGYEDYSFSMNFHDSGLFPHTYTDKYKGSSVRLVK